MTQSLQLRAPRRANEKREVILEGSRWKIEIRDGERKSQKQEVWRGWWWNRKSNVKEEKRGGLVNESNGGSRPGFLRCCALTRLMSTDRRIPGLQPKPGSTLFTHTNTHTHLLAPTHPIWQWLHCPPALRFPESPLLFCGNQDGRHTPFSEAVNSGGSGWGEEGWLICYCLSFQTWLNVKCNICLFSPLPRIL